MSINMYWKDGERGGECIRRILAEHNLPSSPKGLEITADNGKVFSPGTDQRPCSDWKIIMVGKSSAYLGFHAEDSDGFGSDYCYQSHAEYTYPVIAPVPVPTVAVQCENCGEWNCDGECYE
jgi:hypothetical protein